MLLLLPQLFASLLTLGPPQVPAVFPGGEGALANDSYLPTAREAQELLATGDQALLQLRASPPGAADRPRLLTEVLEAWHGALSASVTGDSVEPRPLGPRADSRSPWEDPDGTSERRTEGVEVAVIRRLTSLRDQDRGAWTARFGALAQEQLTAAAGALEPLAELERRHPATPAAARACLLRGELALESGRLEQARTWFERALGHVQLDPAEDPPLSRGLRQRLATVTALLPKTPAPGAWATARSLSPLHQIALVDRGQRLHAAPVLGRGVRPGMCFLDSGLAVVQTAGRVFMFDVPSGQRVADFQPNRLLGDTWTTAAPEARRSEPPGWPLLPATDGEHLILVQGRLEGRLSNVLLSTTIEDTRGPGGIESSGPLLPHLEWALWEGWLLDAAGNLERSGLDLLPGAEFQPGPLIVGSQVLCQIRERLGGEGDLGLGGASSSEGDVRTWLASFDLATGHLLWKRFLSKGVELAEGQGRFGMRATSVSSAQALVARAGRVFAGTHTGAGVLVDAADGRVLWSLRNQRREARSGGWSGARPLLSDTSLLWAPADSNYAYWLRGDADLAGAGLFLHPPHAIGEGLALFGDAGHVGQDALVCSRSGSEFTLASRNARTGRRIDSPYLGPGESFTGAGLASPGRAYFATQTGLYLADRERELFLVDYAALTTNGGPVHGGGSVFARGDRVYVVGPQMLWMFEAR